jgi:hypothetical protein
MSLMRIAGTRPLADQLRKKATFTILYTFLPPRRIDA